jgi:hypothetical protein
VFNELLKVVNQTQKKTNIVNILQNKPVLHLFRVSANARLCADDVPQELCSLRSKGGLGLTDIETICTICRGFMTYLTCTLCSSADLE